MFVFDFFETMFFFEECVFSLLDVTSLQSDDHVEQMGYMRIETNEPLRRCVTNLFFELTSLVFFSISQYCFNSSDCRQNCSERSPSLTMSPSSDVAFWSNSRRSFSSLDSLLSVTFFLDLDLDLPFPSFFFGGMVLWDYSSIFRGSSCFDSERDFLRLEFIGWTG